MIIYASVTGISVAHLFMSGITVGLFMCITIMILVGVISKKRNYQTIRNNKVTKLELFTALKRAALPLLLPIVIIGGIRLGIFSATEAGAVAIIFTLILEAIHEI